MISGEFIFLLDSGAVYRPLDAVNVLVHNFAKIVDHLKKNI